MGIMTRKLGNNFVISSDRSTADAPTNRAPKGRPAESYEVWTGQNWSTEMTEAETFATLDDADDYVRVNFAKVTGLISPQKPSFKRAAKSPTPPPSVTDT